MFRDLVILVGYGLVTAAVAIAVASLLVRGGLLVRNFLIGIRLRFATAGKERSLSFSETILDSLKRPVLVLGLSCIFLGLWNIVRAFGFHIYEFAFASLAVAMAAAGGIAAILLVHVVVKLLDWLVQLAQAIWKSLSSVAFALGLAVGIWLIAYVLRRISAPLFTWPTGISIALLAGLAFFAFVLLFEGVGDRRDQENRWRTAVPAIAAAFRAGDWDRAIEIARDAGPETPGAMMAHTLDAYRSTINMGNLEGAMGAARQAAKWSSAQVLRHANESVATLRTIGTVAPLVALFGTTWAIIRAFRVISTTVSPSPQLVAETIQTAVVDTAICWVIAAVSILIHRYFAAGIGRLGKELDTVQAELLDSLSKSRRASR